MNLTSEHIDQLSAALVAALGEMTDIKKGREAKVPTKAGSSYTYTYADLSDTIQSVRPVLARHGLAVMQNANSDSGEVVRISTTILHSSGQWCTFAPLAMPAGRTPQETGSAISYGRRYHLLAALGLAAEDDDGASASAGRKAQPPKPKVRPVPRTSDEALIREMLADLEPGIAAQVKRNFVARWGTLADLDTAEHPNALAWVEDAVRNMQEANQ